MKTIWWCERVCSKVSSRKRGFWGTHEPQMDKKSSKRSSLSGIPLGWGTWGTMVRLGVVVGLCWVGLAVYAEPPSEGEKVASGQVSAERLPPLDEVEKAVLQADTGTGTLRENWEPVVQLLKPVTVQTPDAVYRLIKAHACLAVNENNEAVCLFLTAQIPEAKKQWWEWAEKFYRQHPDSPIAHYYLADAKARLGKWEEARDWVSQAISFYEANSPDSLPSKRKTSVSAALAYNARGVIKVYLNEIKEAQKDFDTARSVVPTFADGYFHYATLCVQNQDGAGGAFRNFDQALAHSNNFALALAGRAAMRITLKIPKDRYLELAKEEFKSALRESSCFRHWIEETLDQVTAQNPECQSEQWLQELRAMGLVGTSLMKDLENAYKTFQEAPSPSAARTYIELLQRVKEVDVNVYYKHITMANVNPRFNIYHVTALEQLGKNISNQRNRVYETPQELQIGGGIQAGVGRLGIGSANAGINLEYGRTLHNSYYETKKQNLDTRLATIESLLRNINRRLDHAYNPLPGGPPVRPVEERLGGVAATFKHMSKVSWLVKPVYSLQYGEIKGTSE